MFAVVEFVQEGSVETIPVKWIKCSKQHALWPDCKSYSKLKKQLKGEFNLSEGAWSTVPIRILGYTESYSSAKMLEKRITYTSNCDTDVEMLSPKRKRKNRKFSTDSSEEETLSPKRVHTNISQFHGSNHANRLPASQKSNDLEETLNIKIESCVGLLNYEETDVPTGSYSEVDVPETNNFHDGQVSGSSSNFEIQTSLSTSEDILKKILKKVEESSHDIKMLRKEINQIHTAMKNLSADSLTEALPDLTLTSLPLPVTCIDDLQKVEEFLKYDGNIPKMVRLLTKLGGNTIRNAVFNCMQKVFGSQYSRSFSVFGRKGKMPFSHLKLHKVVLSAVQILTNCSEEEGNKRIGIYLSGAVDRFGGRKERSTIRKEFKLKQRKIMN